MNLGGWLSIVPAANINLFGREYSTQNYGFLFTAYGIGALAQGLIGGYIRDTFGTYTYVFYPKKEINNTKFQDLIKEVYNI